jgi:hypothetical protein
MIPTRCRTIGTAAVGATAILLQHAYGAAADGNAEQSAPSPDLIKSLTALLRAAGRIEDTSFFSSERLHAVAEILGAIVWPSVIIVFLVLFRSELRGVIKGIRKLGVGGTNLEVEQEIQEKVDSSAADVLSSPNPPVPAPISSEDIRRAVEVGALSKGIEPEVIRSQIDQISAEYEGRRANMPSGPDRTRQMSAVMAKMRTLGRAVFPYRHELVSSPSPGRKLFAIAALQMIPDYNLLDWLASTTNVESPFVQYQALNALMVALRNAGPEMKDSLYKAIAKAKSGLPSADPDTSRWDLIRAMEKELTRIPDVHGK